MDVGKKLLQNLGNIEKAVITVYEKEEKIPATTDIVSTVGKAQNAALIKANAVAVEAVEKAADSAKKAAKVAEAAEEAAALAAALSGASAIKSTIDKIGRDNLPEIPTPSNMARGKPRTFEVEFNPSELSISGSGGGFVRQQNYVEGEGGSIEYQPIKVNVTLSCRLIFDESDSVTCFSPLNWPGGVAGISSLNPVVAAQDALRIANYLKNGSNVRKNVTALLAAVRNEYCQRVGFTWGRMHYEGDVNNVSAQYTMFNTSGEPVRAVVNFSLLLIQPSSSESINSAVNLLDEPWNSAYKKIFSLKRSPISRLSGAQNVAGSVVNLGL